MSVKIDLHTHTIASPDGSLKAHDFALLFDTNKLDYIAVTDHNTITFAQELQARFGKRIIIGEEISTTQGDIIGLYLNKQVPADMTPQKTVAAIKKQKGLVYIPHPFETVRSGISEKTLQKIINDVDIIEVGNGRAVFQNRSEMAKEWAIRFNKASATSSDSHGPRGWGRTFTVIPAVPTQKTLTTLLHKATFTVQWPGVRGVLYPRLNRLRHRLSILESY